MNLKQNPELIPLIEWWEKDGKSTVIWLLVAAIAVGGWYGWKAHKASVKAAASEAVVNTFTIEEIEAASAKFAAEPVAGALKLRLAKNYYEAGRYEEALGVYEELAGNAPDGFQEVPAVGKAQCLEALKKYDEAAAAFTAFAEANEQSPFALTAKLGAARATAAKGDKTAALKILESAKSAAGEDEIAKARIEATEKLVKRYTPAK